MCCNCRQQIKRKRVSHLNIWNIDESEQLISSSGVQGDGFMITTLMPLGQEPGA